MPVIAKGGVQPVCRIAQQHLQAAEAKVTEPFSLAFARPKHIKVLIHYECK
jgi:hypothetical protein